MTSPAWRDVTAVVVTFNSAAVIEPCLKALAPAARIVVVDNASTDATAATVRKLAPSAEIVANERNVGFGRAANIGFRRADTRFALLVNPDAVIGDEALSRLVAAAEADSRVAIVAPLLTDEHGRAELSVMGPVEHNHRPLDARPEGAFCTWFAMAAVWLCPLDNWRVVGGFDEAIFLYGEDADLCLRATRAGFAIVLVPDAEALHLGGKSSRKTWKSRLVRDWHMTWGHLYLERNHGDAVKAQVEARALFKRHFGRGLLYTALLRWGRAAGNFAKACAAWSFLNGRAPR